MKMLGFQQQTERPVWSLLNWTFLEHFLISAFSSKVVHIMACCAVFGALLLVYWPDVGYVQGMSLIAAVFILNLDTADAFIAFSNLLNKPCKIAFFRVDHGLMLIYFAAFEVFFEENLPKFFVHFKKNLPADIYLIDWTFTLYSVSPCLWTWPATSGMYSVKREKNFSSTQLWTS